MVYHEGKKGNSLVASSSLENKRSCRKIERLDKGSYMLCLCDEDIKHKWLNYLETRRW
jgi:hypothetical protein